MKNRKVKLTMLTLMALQAAVAAGEAPRAPSLQELTPTAEQRDARLGWWREGRFGMFVHWGVYSHLGGTWNGKAYGGYAEHIQRALKIPIPLYLKEVAGNFNPTQFDADAWIRLAKEAGMSYFIITAKHHDGFAMFDSRVSEHTVVKATPWHHDPMPELRAACKKYGVKFGFYYSHAFDWGEENGPGNDWDFDNPGGDKLLGGADWWLKRPEFLPRARKYVDEKSIPQILELIQKYDPDILWYDTPHKLPDEENRRILAAIRKANSRLVVNGRLVRGAGDYANTADRPAEFAPTPGDWEGIPTTNESYAYNQNDHSHKPPAHFIQLLAKAAARGGNMLMNIGPRGDGSIDPKDVAILQGIGEWWRVNGESIRGTTRTPLAVQAWGESTRKAKTLYLHVFDWPRNGKLVVGGLKTDVAKAYLLSDAKSLLPTTRSGIDVVIDVPEKAPHAADSVVVLECSAEPQGDATRLLSDAVAENQLRGFDAQLEGALQFGPGKSSDAWIRNWKKTSDAVVWPVRLHQKTTFEVSLLYDAPTDTERNRVVEGDAGKELVQKGKGAGGVYTVNIGPQTFTKTVKTGLRVSEPLGKITLEPGTFLIRINARQITGEELMRLRSLVLKPVRE